MVPVWLALKYFQRLFSVSNTKKTAQKDRVFQHLSFFILRDAGFVFLLFVAFVLAFDLRKGSFFYED